MVCKSFFSTLLIVCLILGAIVCKNPLYSLNQICPSFFTDGVNVIIYENVREFVVSKYHIVTICSQYLAQIYLFTVLS